MALLETWRRLSLSLLVVAAALAAAQCASPPSPSTQSTRRLAWGHPDLEGVWDYWTFTPVERPDDVQEGTSYSAEEAARLAAERQEQALGRNRENRAGDPGVYDFEVWTDRARATGLQQSSIIIDPASGKIPPLTPEAARQRAAGGHPVRIRTGGIAFNDPEDRGLAERCILGFNNGPPLLPGGYNNNIQINQTPDYVVILAEMNHDARIVPLDDRPKLPAELRQWMGDPHGHWEGDTLVVESANFTDKTASLASPGGINLGSAKGLHLTERFTRVDAKTLTYEFTINDAATFSSPFTGRLPMHLSDGQIFEYACHEGNYGLANMLKGARAEEARRKAGR